jgi:ribosomal protein L34E
MAKKRKAKKRKAKKGKIKRKRTAKKNNPKKRSSRKPGLRVVTTSEKKEAKLPQARTTHDIFEGINGRRPKSDQELNEWLASPEGKAAMAFEPTSVSLWGETGRS